MTTIKDMTRHAEDMRLACARYAMHGGACELHEIVRIAAEINACAAQMETAFARAMQNRRDLKTLPEGDGA